MAYRVMLVDDEEGIVKALRRLLAITPCVYHGVTYQLQVEIFTSPLAALERARHQAFELFLVDYRMPEMDGVRFLTEVRNIQPGAARMILSGYADLNALVGAINDARIYRFLAKPWNDYELVSAIAEALADTRIYRFLAKPWNDYELVSAIAEALAYRDLLVESERLADEARIAQGTLSAEEAELKRLEQLEPGITQVKWGPDGSVILDEEFQVPDKDDT